MATPWLEDWSRRRRPAEVAAAASGQTLDDDSSGTPPITTTTTISSSDAGTNDEGYDDNINNEDNTNTEDNSNAFLGTVLGGPAASDDLDLILQHVDFPLLLSLAAQVKALRDGLIPPHQLQHQYQHHHHRDAEIVDAVQRIQARLLSVPPPPPSQLHPCGATHSTPTIAIIERGHYPITDAVMDDALVELQSEWDAHAYGGRRSSSSMAMDPDPRNSPNNGGPPPHNVSSTPHEAALAAAPSASTARAEGCASPPSNKHTGQSDVAKKTKGEAIAIKYSKWQTDILMGWMIDHSHTPFPEASDIAYLASQTGLTHSQVVNWTTNVRKRNLKATCRGSKKPHHFIDFLFLKQDREARAAGKGGGRDGKATPPNGNNHGSESPNTQSIPTRPTAPATTSRLPGRDDDDVPAAATTKGTPKRPPPPPKHRQVSPSYQGRGNVKPDRRRVRSESPPQQRRTALSIHWDAAPTFHPPDEEQPIDETRDDGGGNDNDDNNHDDESSVCHTLLTDEIWEPLDWKDEANPEVLQVFADYWKHEEGLVHADRWIDLEVAETRETDGPGPSPVLPRSYHRRLALLPSVTRDSHEDDWTLRAASTTSIPVAPSHTPLAMPPPELDDFWYAGHCAMFPGDHHDDGKSREDFPSSWWEAEDSERKVESV